MNQLMAAFMVVAGGLSFYYAFTGKGKVYENDYPKEMKEEACRMMRVLLWVVAPLALASGILEFLGYPWGYFIGLAVLPAIVVYYILFRRKFREYLKKKK